MKQGDAGQQAKQEIEGSEGDGRVACGEQQVEGGGGLPEGFG